MVQVQKKITLFHKAWKKLSLTALTTMNTSQSLLNHYGECETAVKPQTLSTLSTKLRH